MVTEANDTQTSYNIFSDIFLNFYNLYFPIVTIKLNRNTQKIEPWMSKGLLVSRLNKIKLSTLHSKDPTPENREKFKKYRNLYNSLIRISRKLFYDEEFQKHSSNLKKTWQLIQDVIRSGGVNKDPISEIFVSGISYTSPIDIATKLNEFFISAPTAIVNELPATDFPTPKFNTPLNFNLTDSPVTQSEIIEATSQLQNKTSEDLFGVSMSFIKNCIQLISKPLHDIIYKSFESGVVPSQLKIAKVVPIYKGGDRLSPDNYRPISLLPNFSKIVEKIVCNRLTLFLESNNLLSPNQYGFRKEHSTIHPLLHFMNNLTRATNAKKYSVAIFCDLRKAFDTVDHKILISKLNAIGVRGTALKWFVDYLNNRKQFVYIDGVASPLLDIIIGVPQGSILGPLLFIIYINELPLYTSLLNYLFADDTTLQLSHDNPQTLITLVNAEFKKVTDFFKSHRLALHPQKTKFMLFNFKGDQSPQIFINNNVGDDNDPNLLFPIECINLSEKPTVRFLGVLIDPTLTFKSHISNLESKLSRALFFLRKARNVLNQKALKYIYYSLFHSHLIYAVQIYSSTNPNLLKQIYIKQKNAIRILSNAKYNDHTEPLFKNLKILPFPQLCEFFRIQFMQRYVQNFLPSSFDNTWITNRIRRGDEAQIQLRDDDDLHIPGARTKQLSFHPLVLFPKTWETFPNEYVKFLRNKLEFNAELKKHFLDQLSNVPICNRLLCPVCHL